MSKLAAMHRIADQVHPPIDRRAFLWRAGAATVALASAGTAWGRAPQVRSVSLVNVHTAERLSTVYCRGGCYEAAAMRRVDHFLRDFRTGDVHPIDPTVLDILSALRTLVDRDEPFEVLSGYRSPKTNAYLRRHTHGVARHSLHMQGRAIDVRISGFPTRRLRDLALGLRRGGVGFYPVSDFVHIDNGRVRHW
jgi:uncharacterized protein YcbK (DUF882 family)